MALVLTPPTPVAWATTGPTLFLAGSIEMGGAARWQDQVAQALDDLALTILNPRRVAWDASWVQSLESPQFCEQVEWELDGIERADLVLMYFDPATRSPITLLELGLLARGGRLIVCCPEGFWRKGNVDVVCRRYGAVVARSLDELIALGRRRITGLPEQAGGVLS